MKNGLSKNVNVLNVLSGGPSVTVTTTIPLMGKEEDILNSLNINKENIVNIRKEYIEVEVNKELANKIDEDLADSASSTDIQTTFKPTGVTMENREQYVFEFYNRISKYNECKYKGALDKLTAVMGYLAVGGYPFGIYDTDDNRDTIYSFQQEGLGVEDKGLDIICSDLILACCCIIQPSYSLIREVNKFLGLNEEGIVVQEKDIIFPTSLIQRGLQRIDKFFSTDFGIKLFTVLYNSIDDSSRYTNESHLNILNHLMNKIGTVFPINIKSNSVTKTLRNVNMDTKFDIAKNKKVPTQEEIDSRIGFRFLDDLIAGREASLDADILMTWFIDESNYWKEIKDKYKSVNFGIDVSSEGEYTLINAYTKIKEKTNEVGRKLFANKITVNSLGAVGVKGVLPKEPYESGIRMGLIENYIYGIHGFKIKDTSEDNHYLDIIKSVGNTTARAYGDEAGYLDGYYAVSLSVALGMVRENRDSSIKYMTLYYDSVFNTKSNYSDEDFISLTKKYEDDIQKRQSSVNRLQSQVDRLKLTISELNSTEGNMEIEDIEDERTNQIKPTKYISDLNVCIVTEIADTKNIDLIVPLFNSCKVLDNDEALRSKFTEFDFVIYRTDKTSHSVMYNIKSTNKNIIYVEKSEARRWLPSIISQIQ